MRTIDMMRLETEYQKVEKIRSEKVCLLLVGRRQKLLILFESIKIFRVNSI